MFFLSGAGCAIFWAVYVFQHKTSLRSNGVNQLPTTKNERVGQGRLKCWQLHQLQSSESWLWSLVTWLQNAKRPNKSCLTTIVCNRQKLPDQHHHYSNRKTEVKQKGRKEKVNEMKEICWNQGAGGGKEEGAIGGEVHTEFLTGVHLLLTKVTLVRCTSSSLRSP